MFPNNPITIFVCLLKLDVNFSSATAAYRVTDLPDHFHWYFMYQSQKVCIDHSRFSRPFNDDNCEDDSVGNFSRYCPEKIFAHQNQCDSLTLLLDKLWIAF